MSLFLFATAMAVAATSAAAQYSTRHRILMAESADFAVICDGGAICDPTVAPQTVSDRNAEAARIAAKAQRIYDWLQQIGYGPLHVDRHSSTAKFTISVDEDRWCNANNTSPQTTIACHRDSSSRCLPFGTDCREIILTASAFQARQLSGQADPIGGDVIAHEMSHGLNATKMTASDPLWLGEAIADAIGRTWATSGNPPDEIGYLMSLDKPFHAGPDGGYEKAAYLEYVGRKRGSTGLVGYLARFFDHVADGHEGMGYLYNAATAGPGTLFNLTFPEFVARYNSLDASFVGGGLDHYDAYTRSQLIVQSWDAPWDTIHSGNVEEFAADPTHFENLVVPQRPADVEPKDLLYVAEFEITHASNIQNLSLVYEHRLTSGRKHSFVYQADSGIDGGFVRVVNAGITPAFTSAQPYELTFRSLPFEVRLPACVGRGDTAEIGVDGTDPGGTDNWRFRPSAGQVNGRIFTAPNQDGPVTVEMEITSQITRQPGTIAPATPSVRRIELGEIEVAEECDIIVRFSQGPGRIVYRMSGSYSMFDNEEGSRVFFDATRVALNDRGTWINVPASAQAMIRGQIAQLSNQPADAQRPSWATPGPDMLWQMPLVMTEWYDWTEVTDRLFSGVAKRQVGDRVACPDGGQGCVRLTHTMFPGGGLVYDAHRRIARIESSGQWMNFTYGTADGMAKPPGW